MEGKKKTERKKLRPFMELVSSTAQTKAIDSSTISLPMANTKVFPTACQYRAELVKSLIKL
jgi:glutamine synthetase type III